MAQQIEKPAQQNHFIRELFLREFFHRVLIYGYANEIAKAKIKQDLKKLEAWKESKKAQSTQNRQTQNPLVMQRNSQQPPRPSYIQNLIRPAMKPAPRQMKPLMTMATKSQGQEYSPSIASSSQSSALSKILPILNNPSVISIECPGPGKPLLINSYGTIKASQLSLSLEEIKAIIMEISDKTRIPAITGTFKASFDRFIITAVISEFVGIRFIIQKKPNPPMIPQAR